MHDDAFRHATNDVTEAMHNQAIGLYSLVNANAHSIRAWSNLCIGVATGMAEQTQQLWEQAMPRIGHSQSQPRPNMPQQATPQQRAG